MASTDRSVPISKAEYEAAPLATHSEAFGRIFDPDWPGAICTKDHRWRRNVDDTRQCLACGRFGDLVPEGCS